MPEDDLSPVFTVDVTFICVKVSGYDDVLGGETIRIRIRIRIVYCPNI